MTVIEKAASWLENIAADDSHGYDQRDRWGVDYDCSSLVISAYKQAGLDLQSTYTGNMKADFLSHGFVEVPLHQRQRGDVLLNERHHAAMYLGNGLLGQASIAENGTIYADRKGDQTGGEIAVRSYYNFPWDCCLRYAAGEVETAKKEIEQLPMLKYGDTGTAVIVLQALLRYCGYTTVGLVDGDFGFNTQGALKQFQRDTEIEVDGIAGRETWKTFFERL